MTRRSSKIKAEEVIVSKNTEKKLVRSVGRPRKTNILDDKKPEKKVGANKPIVKNEIEKKKVIEKVVPVKIEKVKKIKKAEPVAKVERAFIAEERIEKKIGPSVNSLAIYEKEERKKIVKMWIGVVVFMVFIAGYWIYDTSKIFERSQIESKDKGNDFSFEKLGEATRDVTAGIDEFKQELERTRMMLATTSLDTVATSSASSSDAIDLPAVATSSTLINKEGLTDSEVPKPELIVKELEERLMASSTKQGEVKGAYSERDIVDELKNKLPSDAKAMAGEGK